MVCCRESGLHCCPVKGVEFCSGGQLDHWWIVLVPLDLVLFLVGARPFQF